MFWYTLLQTHTAQYISRLQTQHLNAKYQQKCVGKELLHAKVCGVILMLVCVFLSFFAVHKWSF